MSSREARRRGPELKIDLLEPCDLPFIEDPAEARLGGLAQLGHRFARHLRAARSLLNNFGIFWDTLAILISVAAIAATAAAASRHPPPVAAAEPWPPCPLPWPLVAVITAPRLVPCPAGRRLTRSAGAKPIWPRNSCICALYLSFRLLI